MNGTKSSLHFPLDEPMPNDLIRRIVQFRAVENSNSPAGRPMR
jgi:uncharacterized protein YdhG (YjbR/CyaY superfamily)